MQSPTSPCVSALDLAIVTPRPKAVVRGCGHSLNDFALCQGLLANVRRALGVPGEHLSMPFSQTFDTSTSLVLKGYEVILENVMGWNVWHLGSLICENERAKRGGQLSKSCRRTLTQK